MKTCRDCKALFDVVGDCHAMAGVQPCPRHAAVDELVEAFGRILAGFDDGTWGRNTEKDDDPVWAIKLLPRLRELAEAKQLLARLKEPQ